MSPPSRSSSYGGHEVPEDDAMDTREIYRLLVADHFELLDEPGQARLTLALRSRPDVDPRRFRQELLTACASEDDGARALAFRHGLEAAELQLPRESPRGGWRRFGPIWKMGLAAVIGAGLAAAFLGRAADPPALDRMGQAHLLAAERSGSDASVDLDATTATDLTLVLEARLEASQVRWELLDGNLSLVDQGTIALRGGPRSRTLAVTVAKNQLRAGSTYWLVLTDTTGNPLRRWSFRTD